MDCALEIHTEGRLLTVTGELDVCGARRLDAHAANVLDLSGVTFMDCAGLAALLRARDRAHARGEELVFAGISAPVARVLDATHLYREFVPETADADAA
jgi:anti-anti-sigma factor